MRSQTLLCLGHYITIEGEFTHTVLSCLQRLAVMKSQGIVTDARIRVEFGHEGVPVYLSTMPGGRALVDYGLEERYESIDKLPQWLQTKLNKLHILPDPPPRMDVANLGTKISELVYWVVGPEDETNGHA